MLTITNLLVTAYCSCKICCGPKAHGVTANGLRPLPGVTCAASRNIPFGSKVIVAGHVYTVQDRLAVRFDNRVDLFMPSHKAAQKWGVRNLKVQIIQP